jgi:lipopolysaccharide export LptBFGC system permease protein LptF
VTWISAGQSVYRLLIPCFAACLALGLANWFIQETVLPTANRLQDEARTQLRSHGTVANQGSRYWIARENSIYSFEITPASDNEKGAISAEQGIITKDTSASDNVKQLRSFFGYGFGEGGKLQSVYRSDSAIWAGNEIRFDSSYQQVQLNDAGVTVENLTGGSLPAATMDLAGFVGKPSHLSASQLSQRIDESESETEKRLLTVSLYRRYTTVLLPLVIGLLAAPFGLNLSRKGKVLMAGYAVALWLAFIGISSTFEQMGQNGLLAPILAVWAPLVLFAMIGLYLLSRVRT